MHTIKNDTGSAEARAALAAPSSREAEGMLIRVAAVGGGGSVAAVHSLLAAGVSPDSFAQSGDSNGDFCALAAATLHPGLVRNVQMLLCCGANPDGPPGTRCSPLHCAIMHYNVDAVLFLLKAGADPDMRVPGRVFPPIYHCLQRIKMDASAMMPRTDAVRVATACALLILAAGANTHAPVVSALEEAPDVGPPLIYAAGLGDVALPVIDALLKAGADTEAVDSDGRTALVIAATSALPAPRVVSRLLAAGADPAPPLPGAASGPGEITVPYLYALARSPRRVASLEEALAAGADPSEFVTAGVDPTGELCGVWTPLALSIFDGDGAGVAALLEWGACPTTPVGYRGAAAFAWSNARAAGKPDSPTTLVPTSPLALALTLGLSPVFHALVAAGAHIADELRLEGDEALSAAVCHCDASVVQAIIAAGLPLRPPPPREPPLTLSGVGGTPFGNALEVADASAVRYLLDAGLGTAADVAAAVATHPPALAPLGALGITCSSKVGAPGLAELLLTHPITRHAASQALLRRDRQGRTALWHAADKGHGALVLELLAAGADANAAAARGADGASRLVPPLELMVEALGKPRNRPPLRRAAAEEAIAALRMRTTEAALISGIYLRRGGSSAVSGAGVRLDKNDADSDGEEDHPRNRGVVVHADDVFAAVGLDNAEGVRAYVSAVSACRGSNVRQRHSLETLAILRLNEQAMQRKIGAFGDQLTAEDVRRVSSVIDRDVLSKAWEERRS